MIGFFDYTMLLTYLSLLSATMGIIVCLHGIGHPFLGMFFLMFSGLCDTFDGRVARTKKDRTQMQKDFGVQIDSLSDLVAFGVLPGCIGIAMLRVSVRFSDVPVISLARKEKLVLYPILLTAVVLFYVLMAMIRLAYFNITGDERKKQADKSGGRTRYTGLPVTSAALIFPTVMLIQFLTKADLTLLYFVVMAVVSVLFVSKIHIPKPGLKAILIMVGIGAVEFLLLLLINARVV